MPDSIQQPATSQLQEQKQHLPSQSPPPPLDDDPIAFAQKVKSSITCGKIHKRGDTTFRVFASFLTSDAQISVILSKVRKLEQPNETLMYSFAYRFIKEGGQEVEDIFDEPGLKRVGESLIFLLRKHKLQNFVVFAAVSRKASIDISTNNLMFLVKRTEELIQHITKALTFAPEFQPSLSKPQADQQFSQQNNGHLKSDLQARAVSRKQSVRIEELQLPKINLVQLWQEKWQGRCQQQLQQQQQQQQQQPQTESKQTSANVSPANRNSSCSQRATSQNQKHNENVKSSGIFDFTHLSRSLAFSKQLQNNNSNNSTTTNLNGRNIERNSSACSTSRSSSSRARVRSSRTSNRPLIQQQSVLQQQQPQQQVQEKQSASVEPLEPIQEGFFNKVTRIRKAVKQYANAADSDADYLQAYEPTDQFFSEAQEREAAVSMQKLAGEVKDVLRFFGAEQHAKMRFVFLYDVTPAVGRLKEMLSVLFELGHVQELCEPGKLEEELKRLDSLEMKPAKVQRIKNLFLQDGVLKPKNLKNDYEGTGNLVQLVSLLLKITDLSQKIRKAQAARNSLLEEQKQESMKELSKKRKALLKSSKNNSISYQQSQSHYQETHCIQCYQEYLDNEAAALKRVNQITSEDIAAAVFEQTKYHPAGRAFAQQQSHMYCEKHRAKYHELSNYTPEASLLAQRKIELLRSTQTRIMSAASTTVGGGSSGIVKISRQTPMAQLSQSQQQQQQLIRTGLLSERQSRTSSLSSAFGQ